MEYRQLGRAGVRVSSIGLGTDRFGTDQLPQEEVSKIIDAALDTGGSQCAAGTGRSQP
jgi:aryl-alcohol dehydrogenase-like predicted oxidoreductase